MKLPFILPLSRNVLQWKSLYDYRMEREKNTGFAGRLFLIAAILTMAFDALNTLYRDGNKFPALKTAEIYTRSVLIGLSLYHHYDRSARPKPFFRITVQQGLNIARLFIERNHSSYPSRADWLVASSLDIGFRLGAGSYA